jgi:hypothetical protein
MGTFAKWCFTAARGWCVFKFPKIPPSRIATLGCLIGAGAVGVPLAVFVLTLGMLLESESTLVAKIVAPFAGAFAMFVFGFLYYVPSSIVLGGLAHGFLKSVGLKSRPAYLCAGPVVGLALAMITHFFIPEIIDELLLSIWNGYVYVVAFATGGVALMLVFWHIRRPDRPWDDLADRRLAGENL